MCSSCQYVPFGPTGFWQEDDSRLWGIHWTGNRSRTIASTARPESGEDPVTTRIPFTTLLTVLVATIMISTSMTPVEAEAGEGEAAGTPPATQLSLDALLAATPADIPDTDADGLPDSVEAVFGTSADEPDSDLDGLDDRFELEHGLNPTDLDSNSDGLPDNLELQGPADLDDDGVPNEWDDDNDNDGVRDGFDLAPNARSSFTSKYTIDVTTTGQATYLDFQVRPLDSTHLTLGGSAWDWPWDDQGFIRDLVDAADASDVVIHPMLQLQAADGPEQADVESYGIVSLPPNESAGDSPDDWKVLVPLLPVVDNGDVVAFSGRMFYPKGTYPAMTTVELVWVVQGPIDSYSASVAAEAVDEARKGEIQSKVGWPPPIGGTLTSNSASCIVDAVAVAPLADPAGYELEYRCEEPLSDGAQFTPGGSYEYLVDGTTITGVTDTVPITEASTIIARYREEFMLTGLEATENLDIELGVVYGDDPEQVIGAGLTLDYEYLRSQNSLPAAIAKFADLGLGGMHAVTESVDHVDAALMRGTEILDSAFEGVKPVFTIVGERSTTRGPAEWVTGVPLQAATDLTIDLSDQSFTVTTKSMALEWYDQSKRTITGDFLVDLEQWNLSPGVFDDVAMLTLLWTAGETHVTNVGGSPVPYKTPEAVSVLTWIEAGTVLSADGRAVAVALDTGLSSWRYVPELSSGGLSKGLKGMSITSIEKLKVTIRDVWAVVAMDKTPLGKVSKFGKFLKGAAVVGRIAEAIGLVTGVVQWGTIWASSGWTIGGFIAGYGAFYIYALTAAVFFVLGSLEAICAATVGVGCAVAGVVGVVLAALGGLVLLLDFMFKWGWWNRFEAWWNSLWSERTWPLVDLTFDYTRSPALRIGDLDDNGLDIGDEIRLEAETRRTHMAQKGYALASDMWFSGIFPGMVADACAADANGVVSCLPTNACTGSPGESSCSGDIADISETRTDLQTIFDPEAIWDFVAAGYPSDLNYRCDQMQDGNVTDCWITVDSRLDLVATPKVESVDFQLKAGTAYNGQIMVYHEPPWWKFQDPWRSLDSIGDDGSENMETIHLDVLPANIADFVTWPVLTALDSDRDGLPDGNDPNSGMYDTDSDGLSDRFERDLGTSPTHPDTDGDLIPDGQEVRDGTNPRDADTDDDTMLDADELLGWQIEIEYFGTTFTTKVESDPLYVDADNDDLTDMEERLLGTNPNAWDSDGDGFRDGPNTDPVTDDDTYTTAADTALTVPAPGLLENDVDNEQDPIRVATLDTTATSGSVVWSTDGAFTYDPDGEYDSLGAGEQASDSFMYTLADGRGGEDTATVTIVVIGTDTDDDDGGIGPPPTFVDDDASIFQADIERLAAAGITKGCNPPTNDRFCPDSNVTRGQMAAFLHRALE